MLYHCKVSGSAMVVGKLGETGREMAEQENAGD